MKRNLFIGVALAISLLLVSGPALAHHGTNLYDMMKTTTLKGTITKFEWGNPHNQIYFDVTDDKGTVVHWAAEMGSPSANTINGWSRTSVRPGDTITMYMHQSKTGTPVGRLTRIVLSDGKSLCDHGCTPGDKNQGY